MDTTTRSGRRALDKISLYLGDQLAGGIVRWFSSIDKIAPDELYFEVIGNDIDTGLLPDSFCYHDVGRTESDGIFDRLVNSYIDVGRYLRGTDIEPACVWQITMPTYSAVPVMLAAKRHGTTSAARIPSQIFMGYKEARGPVKKAGMFTLNNFQLRLLRFSPAVSVLSENSKSHVVNAGIPASKVWVLPQPINTSEFYPVSSEETQTIRRELGMAPDTTCVLFIGRLTRLKGIETMIEVVRAFQDDDGIEFHFVGDGPYAEALAGLDNVHLHGYVDPNRIHWYHKAADILLHPQWMPGVSWAMLEAAATGLPIVARDAENTHVGASFVCRTTSDFIDYLRTPDRWTPAPFPHRWSIDGVRDQYLDFFDSVVGDS